MGGWVGVRMTNEHYTYPVTINEIFITSHLVNKKLLLAINMFGIIEILYRFVISMLLRMI